MRRARQPSGPLLLQILQVWLTAELPRLTNEPCGHVCRFFGSRPCMLVEQKKILSVHGIRSGDIWMTCGLQFMSRFRINCDMPSLSHE